MRARARLGAASVLAAANLVLWSDRPATASQPSLVPEQTFRIVARKFAFAPSRVEVTAGELVRIELHSADIAHSLTIDGYRLAKRVDAGQTVVFEFRAERAGTFPFSCNLQIDEGCRRMRGELVVRPRR